MKVLSMQEIYQAISKGELKRNSAQDPKREIKSVFNVDRRPVQRA